MEMNILQSNKLESPEILYYSSRKYIYIKIHNTTFMKIGEGPVEEVSPLCEQRRSLLAQTGSSNNHTMLQHKFLIEN